MDLPMGDPSRNMKFYGKSSILMILVCSWIATLTSECNGNEKLHESISRIFRNLFMGAHCNILFYLFGEGEHPIQSTCPHGRRV